MDAFMPRLCGVAILAWAMCIFLAPSVPAQTITPSGTAVSGTGANPTLSYGSAFVKCNNMSASGTTKSPASTNVDVAVTFSGNCNISGLGATVTCSGTVNMKASLGITSGTLNLNSGFTCTISVSGVCNIDIEGPQTTGVTGTFDETMTTLAGGSLNVNATRTGSSLCGPASGTGLVGASLNVTPNTITIT